MLPCLESLDSRLLDLAPGAGSGTDSRLGGTAVGLGAPGWKGARMWFRVVGPLGVLGWCSGGR
jgi:hypothetical protein